MTEQHFVGKEGEKQVEKLLEQGLSCDNEITVSYAVDCFMHVMSFMHDKVQENGMSMDEAFMSIACTFVATLVKMSENTDPDLDSYTVM